jgi:hypothetical protein
MNNPVPPGKPAVQDDGLGGAVLPDSAGVQGVLPYIRETSGTPREEAAAKADTPFARQARSGDPPKPGATKTKRKPTTGRLSDGPACIGCISYQALYRDGLLYGYGACLARNSRPVAANNRSACALYEFHYRYQRR